MKWWRLFAILLGAIVGALVVVWWIYDRRLPTMRYSYTVGKGSSVGLEWIELK